MYAITRIERCARVLPLRLVSTVAVAIALLLPGALPAQAQATRTWVSGVGDDVNPCSRTAPCKTFAGAISKTAAGGEINALDPGGYGTVTITKSITIDGTGTHASILASGTNGVIINNAAVPPVVVLRGLSINGTGGVGTDGIHGIRVLSGATVFVEDVTIDGFSSNGIDFHPAANAEVYVTNTSIRNVGGSAIFASVTTGLGTILVDGSRLENNGHGVNASNNTRVTVNNSVVANNTNVGLFAQTTVGTASPVQMSVERTVVASNGTGIQATGVGAASQPTTIRITNTTIVNNTTGINATAPAVVASFGNNRIAGNTTNGAPTTTVAQQ